jgi:mannose/fructose/N-acetylgalactosamine-specific phosphotransferase system component IIC
VLLTTRLLVAAAATAAAVQQQQHSSSSTAAVPTALLWCTLHTIVYGTFKTTFSIVSDSIHTLQVKLFV